jgi:hypothetical protein
MGLPASDYRPKPGLPGTNSVDARRRDDREMAELEAVFIGLLLENREALARAWPDQCEMAVGMPPLRSA